MKRPLALLQGLLDGSPEAALLVGATGNVLHMNKAAERMLCLSWGAHHAKDTDSIGDASPAKISCDITSFFYFRASRTLGGVPASKESPSWKDVIQDILNPSSGEVSSDVEVSWNWREIEAAALNANGDRFPVLLNVKRLENSGERHIQDAGGDYLYCVYAQNLAPAHRQNQRRIEELEKQVRQLSRQNDAIVEASSEDIIVIDSKGIIQTVCQRLLDHLGYREKGEVLGNHISLLIDDQLAPKHGFYRKQCMNRREVEARRKDGTSVIYEIGMAELQCDVGEEHLIVVMMRNISKEKSAQNKQLLGERIKRGARERSLILDASFDPMFSISETGIIFMVNQAAVDQFGWSREEFIGSNISMIVGGEHQHRHDEYIERYLKTGGKRVMGKKRELPARRKNGSEFIIELGLTEVKAPVGEERMFCGFIKDLTRQKQDEMELKRKQRVTLSILEASFDAMFLINENGLIQMVNQAAVSKFGWKREEFLGKNISMIVGGNHAANHDRYIARYLKTGEKHVMGKKRELRARRKDGSEFTIELGLTEVKTEPGEKRMFCGFIKDLTRQKEAERDLRVKQSITMGIVEASYDAMFAIDENCAIQMVNEASCEVFGWSREELMGGNISMIVDESIADKHDSFVKRYLETGVKRIMGSQREVIARRKDGSTFPCILGIQEVKETGIPHVFVAFIRDLTNEKLMNAIEAEKLAAEALLMNMLPEDIALRLKDDPSHIAEHFSCTTILFADIVGFTDLASSMPPTELVRMLNDLFCRFDELVDKYDLNKVKTIGDCYMATSIPRAEHQDDDCSRVCHFGIDMLDELRTFNREKHTLGGHNLDLRVGINTGPVVAGVVGTKRFVYDLWGDAVNLASRMESTGIPGKIHCTKAVVEHAGNDFYFESRGMIHIKGKGNIDSFILVERKNDAILPSLQDRSNKRPTQTLLESIRQLQLSRSLHDLAVDKNEDM